MPEQATVANDLAEHPAVRAWCQFCAGRIPREVETLKLQKGGRLVVSGEENPRRHVNHLFGQSMVYRLCGVGPRGCHVIAKQCPRQGELAERIIYEKVLPRLPFPTVQFYGMLEEEGGEFCWLFMEDAGGAPYCPDAEEHGVIVAEWLGLLHTSGTAFVSGLGLPERGPKHYWQYLQPARERIRRGLSELPLNHEDRSILSGTLAQCDAVEQCWSQIQEYCDEAPRAFVHADIHVDHLRLKISGTETIVLAFDWQLAGWGVPATDLILEGLHLPTYWSVVRKFWPLMGMRSVRRLANVGKIFYLIWALNLESEGLVPNWRWKLMRNMEYYKTELRRALKELRF